MSPSAKLTAMEKLNGKRDHLVPSKEIQKKMHPVSYDAFAAIVNKASPPSLPEKEEQ